MFPDERRRLLASLAEAALAVPEGTARGTETGSRRLLEDLRRAEGPVPPALAQVARRLLARTAREELAALADSGPVTAAAHRLRELVAEARSLGIPLDLAAEQVGPAIRAGLGRVIASLRTLPMATGVTDGLALLALGTTLESPPDLWEAQNAVAALWREASPSDRDLLAPLMSGLGFAPGALAASRDVG